MKILLYFLGFCLLPYNQQSKQTIFRCSECSKESALLVADAAFQKSLGKKKAKKYKSVAQVFDKENTIEIAYYQLMPNDTVEYAPKNVYDLPPHTGRTYIVDVYMKNCKIISFFSPRECKLH